MVARAVTANCKRQGDDVIALTREELEISDRESVFRAFDEHLPEIVFNCAAYTNVDGAEKDEAAAYAANASGPENLAAGSREFGSGFITISTDYVFDGTKDGFYSEDDRPNPQSVYARSKYEGELRCAAANPNSIIIRSGWIFGHGGANFLSKVPVMLKSTREIKAIDDTFGTPTFADDLAIRMRELALGKTHGVVHVVNSGTGSSYFEFVAEATAILADGYDNITRVSFLDLKRQAVRPLNSKLGCLRSEILGLEPMRDWKAALTAFILGS